MLVLVAIAGCHTRNPNEFRAGITKSVEPKFCESWGVRYPMTIYVRDSSKGISIREFLEVFVSKKAPGPIDFTEVQMIDPTYTKYPNPTKRLWYFPKTLQPGEIAGRVKGIRILNWAARPPKIERLETSSPYNIVSLNVPGTLDAESFTSFVHVEVELVHPTLGRAPLWIKIGEEPLALFDHHDSKPADRQQLFQRFANVCAFPPGV